MQMLHTMYSKPVSSLKGYNSNEISNNVQAGRRRHHRKVIKGLQKALLDKDCETAVYAEPYDLDHVAFDLEQIACMEPLETSSSERLNVQIKQAYRITSQAQSSGAVDTTGVLDTRRE